MALSWSRGAAKRSLFAALFVVVSLFVAAVPVAAQGSSDGADVACIWVMLMPTDGGAGESCPEPTDEELRMLWVGALAGALESYGSANGTYKVPDSGFDGNGNGWAIWEGNRYETSIASRLSAEGFLPTLENSSYWDRTVALAASQGVAAVYRCKDRVAVFNVRSSAHASPSDSNWWANNGCNQYPIDGLGATYFVLGRGLGHLDGADGRENLRVTALDAMMAALESYEDANGTFRVQGAGFDGNGHGWGFYEGDRYETSIASVLIAEGHLEADPAHDPMWAETIAMAEGEGAVAVYTCEGRVGVFTRHETAETSTFEADWWDENDCRRYPIDSIGATYFRVSSLDTCDYDCTESWIWVML